MVSFPPKAVGHTTKVVACVANAFHPLSGRPRRGASDARALELALSLTASPIVVHAGSTGSSSLLDYLGMGVAEITVIHWPRNAAPAAALVSFLREVDFDLVLMGIRAESGMGSGMTPYSVGHALNYPVVSGIVGIEKGEDAIGVLQALPWGRQRRLNMPVPFIATVGMTAPPPRPVAFGLARKGRIREIEPAYPVAAPDEITEWVPARRRPKRIHSVNSALAQTRMESVMGRRAKASEQLVGLSPEAAARAILQALAKEKVLLADKADRD